ncbi:MAG: urease accessory protein UreD [Shimia sp.]
MFDAAPLPTLQRTRGAARIAVAAREGGGARIVDLAQSGAAKAMWPRVHGTLPEAVFLNTAGGLTGGDRLSYEVEVGPGARLTATTQTAERAYASPGDAATLDVTARVGEGAHLNWLPQATILFERSRLDRRTAIDLAPGATVLALEMVALGRAAMGERLTDVRLTDRRTIARDGVPLWIDPFAVTPDGLHAAAALNGAGAVATLVLVASWAEDVALGPAPDGVDLQASAWEGRLVVRAAAPDLFSLERALAPLLARLAGGALPRVW